VSANPVVERLRARAAAGSRPGERAADDTDRIALVVEGGGMRGVISSAMAAELEARGLTDAFDLAVGTSAGALNAAALLAGVAAGCTEAYVGPFSGRAFINPWRLLGGRRAVDVGYTLRYAGPELDADRHRRTFESPIALHCVATDVDAGKAVDLHGFADAAEMLQALLATSRLPWVGGPPVALRGRRWLDGGLVEAIPVRTALELGATHVLVLQTRPPGVARSTPPGPIDRLIERHLHRLNPALVALYRGRIADYERTTAEIDRLAAAPGPPYVRSIRPVEASEVVGQLERDPVPLHHAAAAARAEAAAALDGAQSSTK
jgi:predicted patatin/cPLA2 family phospholipase